MKETELIWVDKKFAVEYNKLKSDEEKEKVFEEYLSQLSLETQKEFKVNLESIEEDVAIYTGLMLKAKQAFEKAKNEQLTASYELWEGFEKELPSTKEKVNKIVNILKPLTAELKQINDLLREIDIHNIEGLSKTITDFVNLYGENREVFDFLIKNFYNREKTAFNRDEQF